MSDTDKAQRDFHLQAMKEAIERMKPELMAASEAAHRSKEKDDKGPGSEELDRTIELGYLVDYLSHLCAPHLMLLDHIAEVLAALEEGEAEGAAKPVHRH
jgi:hypothetical protein